MIKLKQRRAQYVNGEWLASSDVEPVINPATEEVFAEAPIATKAHVEAALAAARTAFDKGPWPRMSQIERQQKILQFLDAIERRATEIVPLIIEESGSLPMLAQ